MLTANHKIQFKTGRKSKKLIRNNVDLPPLPQGRLPRITKMMALAIRLDHLIKSGQVIDQAELARVGHVSRARLTQIMDLNLLAPDIQEEILDLPLVRGGKDKMLGEADQSIHLPPEAIRPRAGVDRIEFRMGNTHDHGN